MLVPIVAVGAAAATSKALELEPVAAGFVLLLAVTLGALTGRVGGLICAVLASVVFDLAFLPPSQNMRLGKISDLIVLGAFVVVALLVGTLASRASALQAAADRGRADADLAEAKAAFFAAAGHNLRTPLTTVTSAVDTLLTTDSHLTPEQRRELLESIRDETLRLGLLVSRTMEQARIHEGGFAPRPADIDALELVQAAVRRLGPVASGRCTYDDADQMAVLYADAALTEEILTVLIENACRYAPAGTPIDVVATTDDGEIEVAVIDHGAGVPEADRDRIFAQYERGGHDADIVGTGIGLTVARELAEVQDGTVSVRATPGGGATFALRLPAGGR